MMRRFFAPLLCCVCIAPVYGNDAPPKIPSDFAYTEIHTAFSDNGTPVHTDIKRVTVSGHHQRTDRFDGPFQITDSSTSRMVSVDPRAKTYTVYDRQRTINADNGTQTESEIPKRPAPNYYKALDWMPDDATRTAIPGHSMVNGVRCTQTRVSEVHSNGSTNTTTSWTAVESGRIIQVRATLTPAGQKTPELVILRTAFNYQPVADKSIFSLVPPSGYEVKSQAILGLTSQRH